MTDLLFIGFKGMVVLRNIDVCENNDHCQSEEMNELRQRATRDLQSGNC